MKRILSFLEIKKVEFLSARYQEGLILSRNHNGVSKVKKNPRNKKKLSFSTDKSKTGTKRAFLIHKTTLFKGTVIVVSSDLPIIDKHDRFSTVPFKPLPQGAETSCLCVCTKRVCVRNIEGVYCSYIQYIRISVFLVLREYICLLITVYLKISLIFM